MKLRIWAALGAVYLIWGSTYLAIRFAIETMPPFLMGGLRFLIAGTALFAVRRLMGDKPPSKTEWRSAGIVGLFLLTGGNGCVVFAEQWVSSSLTALLIATTPLWIVLIDWLRPGGHRPTGRALLGVLVGFGGVALLIGPSEIALGGRMELVGALIVVLGAFLWAVGSLYGRGAALPSSPLLGTSMEMLIGGGGLLILGTLAGQWNQFDPAAFSTKSTAAFVYLIVFGAWIAFSAYVWLSEECAHPARRHLRLRQSGRRHRPRQLAGGRDDHPAHRAGGRDHPGRRGADDICAAARRRGAARHRRREANRDVMDHAPLARRLCKECY